jgi:hypothetical protein
LIGDSRRKYERSQHGDRLEDFSDEDLIELPGGNMWIAFRSVLQGDHLGVEVATQAHANLLRSYALPHEDCRVTASRPLRSSKIAEGLVIDDYFAVSIQPKLCSSQPRALLCYETAQRAYQDFDILGSPQKDVIGACEGKVIGAYINGPPVPQTGTL